MRVYDIIIAGAGPAGLSAAIELSKLHANALLLEQGKWCTPENKSWSTFESTLREFKLISCKLYRMDKVAVHMAATKGLSFGVHKDPLWTIDEPKALRTLLHRVTIAKRQDTKVIKLKRRNNRVYIYTNRGVFVAKVFIDATGNGAVTRKHFKLPMDTYSWLHCQVREGCNFSGHTVAWAYGGTKKAKKPFFVGWMSPYSKDKVLTATFRVAGKNAPTSEHVKVIDTMLNDAYYKPMFTSSHITKRFNGYIPMTPLKQIVYDNMLVIGDAAGFTPPLTQEGVRPGLELGRLAGRAAVDAVARGVYTQAALFEFINETRLGKKLFFENLDLNKILQLLLYYLNDKEIVRMALSLDSRPNSLKLNMLRSELTITDLEQVFALIFKQVSLRELIKRVSEKDRHIIISCMERYAADIFEDELEHIVHKL